MRVSGLGLRAWQTLGIGIVSPCLVPSIPILITTDITVRRTYIK